MKPERFEEIKLLFYSITNIVIPDSSIRADFYKKGWVCFYFYPFDVGLTFSFSKFIVNVLKTLNVSPGQLMSFTWRTLKCLDSIKEKHSWRLTSRLWNILSLKKFSNCRVGFANKDTDDPLILNNDTVNDRNRKKNYIFAEKKKC